MILACGTCAHWLLWTSFPAATPWAVTFMIWFLVLAVVATVARVRLAGVPGLAAAVALVFGSLVVGVAVLGPLAGLWFAPSCLLGSVAAARLGSQGPRAHRVVFSTAAVAVVVLGALWVWSAAAQRRLSGAERVLLLDGTPAWPVELRRVGRGECATLEEVAEKASDDKLAETATSRLTDECPAP